MVANFLPLLVLLLLFLKPNVANLLTARGTSTWMLFIWILFLATVLPLVAFNMPSFWWTGALSTIGHLVLRLCPRIASFWHSSLLVTAGSLAQCFYCDCNTKLFGTAISKYLMDNGSKNCCCPCQASVVELPCRIPLEGDGAYVSHILD
jgi:hypothetical protein